MQISIQKTLLNDIRSASRAMGFSEDEFAHRALRYYLTSIRDEIALQQELNAWEGLSEESLSGFERQLHRGRLKIVSS